MISELRGKNMILRNLKMTCVNIGSRSPSLSWMAFGMISGEYRKTASVLRCPPDNINTRP